MARVHELDAALTTICDEILQLEVTDPSDQSGQLTFLLELLVAEDERTPVQQQICQTIQNITFYANTI